MPPKPVSSMNYKSPMANQEIPLNRKPNKPRTPKHEDWLWLGRFWWGPGLSCQGADYQPLASLFLLGMTMKKTQPSMRLRLIQRDSSAFFWEKYYWKPLLNTRLKQIFSTYTITTNVYISISVLLYWVTLKYCSLRDLLAIHVYRCWVCDALVVFSNGFHWTTCNASLPK